MACTADAASAGLAVDPPGHGMGGAWIGAGTAGFFHDRVVAIETIDREIAVHAGRTATYRRDIAMT